LIKLHNFFANVNLNLDPNVEKIQKISKNIIAANMAPNNSNSYELCSLGHHMLGNKVDIEDLKLWNNVIAGMDNRLNWNRLHAPFFSKILTFVIKAQIECPELLVQYPDFTKKVLERTFED